MCGACEGGSLGVSAAALSGGLPLPGGGGGGVQLGAEDDSLSFSASVSNNTSSDLYENRNI